MTTDPAARLWFLLRRLEDCTDQERPAIHREIAELIKEIEA